MKDKTALTELIEWVDMMRNSVASLTFTEKDFRTLDQFEEQFKKLLPKERQDLVKAFEEGQGFDMGYTGDDYVGFKFGL